MSRYNLHRPRAPRRQIDWRQGDIAFLKHYESFSSKDHADLIASGYLDKEATVHPVIVLAILNDKVIITPVSAFSTEEKRFLPPWEQKWHQSKKRDHFRAFEGSKRPNNNHPALRLADASMKMPKPQASWIYTQHFFCVPISVLGWFNKSPTLLRVHPESIRQLTLEMKSSYPQRYSDAGARLKGVDPTGTVTVSSTSQSPEAPKTHIRIAKKTFAQIAHRPDANRPQHLLARTPGVRVAS